MGKPHDSSNIDFGNLNRKENGMVLHLKSGLTEEWEGDAGRARKMTAKGPKPKSGRRRKLADRISHLILKDRRGPCAIMRILGGETPAEAFGRKFKAGQETLNKLGAACL